jgi:phosphoribosylpyrophosphate synthetase
MFVTFWASLRIHLQMLRDAGKAKDVFVICTHPRFLENIIADRAMKIFVDIIFEAVAFVTVRFFYRGTSHHL